VKNNYGIPQGPMVQLSLLFFTEKCKPTRYNPKTCQKQT
jgi:hypothetical protein